MEQPGNETVIEGYKSLIAWQKAMQLVVLVYKVTDLYPARERFGLTIQSRRATVGIPSNIAEGYGRRTRADYVHFLDIARGSANELETQLLIAVSLNFITELQARPAMELALEVQRILKGLVVSLEAGDKTTVRNRG